MANKNLDIVQGVFDSIPGFVSLFGKNLKYMMVNKTLADACNLNKDDFVDKDLGFIDSGSISEPDMKQVMESFISSDEEIRQQEFLITAPNGDKTNTLTTLKKINKGSQIVVVSIDNTERKIEQDIILKQKDLLIKNSRFTSIGKASGEVAHEIASPLLVITSIANRLKKFKLVNEDQEQLKTDFIEKMLRQAARIQAITDRLRRVSRTGEHDHFEVTPFKNIFEDAFEVVHEKLRKNHVIMEHNIDGAHIRLECLRIPLSQVFINLFNNACDAIQDQEDRWIKIELSENIDNVIIQLTDSGSGIPPEVADRIFDNGFTTKDIGKGTGLGMSITKDIVEKHNGSIGVNQESSNTQFLISLPKKHIVSQQI